MPSARRGRKPKLQDRLLGRDKTLDHAGPCGSFAPVFGAIINAVAILVGGLFGVTNPNALSVGFQLRAKMFIGLCEPNRLQRGCQVGVANDARHTPGVGAEDRCNGLWLGQLAIR